MSWSQVCGFIATMRSTPPRRPRQPFSLTRTSNQVGSPWILDGKMLRGATGIPMRRIDLANSRFADAEPEPLTLANFTTKSLTRSMGATVCFIRAPLYQTRPCELLGSSGCLAENNPARRLHYCRCPAVAIVRLRRFEKKLLHVPGARRAALRAQAAVQAHVLILDHHPARLQSAGDVEVLRHVARRRVQARA